MLGAFLRHERGNVALVAGFCIDFLGLLALADDPTDVAVADGHDELIDAGVIGERENIDRFDLLAVRILELLRDGDGRDIRIDRGFDGGVFEGNGDHFFVLLDDEGAAGGDGFIILLRSDAFHRLRSRRAN